MLHRHTLHHPDGRRLWVYGDLRGQLPASEPPAGDPAALHRRWDALTGAWVAVSPARNQRPQTGHGDQHGPRPACPLCPGGPEVPFSYDAAVFENRFPSLESEPPPIPDAIVERADAVVAPVAPSTGRCEVVLYTEQHEGSLATLEPERIARVVAVWRDRSRALWADPLHEYVLVFENRGDAVGATLSHPHGQIYAFDHLPPLIVARDERLRTFRAEHGRCLTCDVVAFDQASDRQVLNGFGALVVAVPFAPRWPYEAHVRARRHGCRRLTDLRPDEEREVARALRAIVSHYDGLFDAELAYMMTVMEAPHGQDDWHLAFEFLPPHRAADKLKIRASVETSTGLFVNDTMPETSAARLAAVAIAETGWEGVHVPTVVPLDGDSESRGVARQRRGDR